MMFTPRVIDLCAYALIAFLIFGLLDAVHAQALIGGGGGGGAAFIDTLFTLALNVVFGLAIVFCGIMVATGHHEFFRIGLVAVGLLIAFHWRDIINALGGQA